MYSPGTVGPWDCNDPGVRADGYILDGGLERTRGTSPSCDGVAAATSDPHRSRGRTERVPTGQRLVLYHYPPFVAG